MSKKVRIFVGCPSDVAAERDIVIKAAQSLNKIAQKQGLELEVIYWGHVSSDTGRPQDVIFEQLPPEEWDVFICILWHRFGTAPAAKDPISGNEYLAGTEEEFRTAYNLWKQNDKPRILMYCCKKAIPPNDLVPEQFALVKKFLKEIQDPNGAYRMLTTDFADSEAFKEIIIRDLQQIIIEFGTPPQINNNNEPKVISNLPPRPDFFGREKDLQKVRSAISQDCKEWGILVDAIGGMGKTALAIEAAYRAKDDAMFKAYVFLTAKQKRLESSGVVDEDADALATDDFINETARVLGKQGIAQMERKDKRKALFDLLNEVPTLLIYDNLETLKGEQEAIVRFLHGLPTASKAILTSRQAGSGDGRHLSLKSIEDEASEQIIEKEINKDDLLAAKLNKHKDQWKELYRETYGSPLALMHILGLLKVRRSLNFKGAIELLQTKKGIEERIDFMFSEARKELNENDWKTLYSLSFFVPSADVAALISVAQLEVQGLTDAIDHLGKLNLVDAPDTDRYMLHPLTREFVQKELLAKPGTANDTGMQFAQYWLDYAKKYGGRSEKYKTYSFLENEWSNIEITANWLWKAANVVGNTIKNISTGKMLNDLASNLSQFLLYSGRWEERILIEEWCYSIMIMLEDAYEAGWRAYDVARTWWNRRNTEESENWTKKAIEAWKRGGGKEYEAEGLRILGLIAAQRNDLQEAEKYCLEALDIYREIGEREDIANTLNSLGNIAKYREQYDKAEEYLLEAIDKTSNLGNKAIFTVNLGGLDLARRNLKNARKWLGDALQMAREAGMQSIIGTSYQGLATLEEIEGDYSHALVIAEMALKIREQLQHMNLQETQDLVARLKEKIAESNP